MKEINGKKFYICLGYIDPELLKINRINAKDIQPIYVESKDSNIVYVDDSDKDNTVVLPLFPVNQIQKRGIVFNFRILINPNKIHFEENETTKKINVVGLFVEYKKDSIEYIKHIQFYRTNNDNESTFGTIISKNDSAITYSLSSSVKTITEAVK